MSSQVLVSCPHLRGLCPNRQDSQFLDLISSHLHLFLNGAALSLGNTLTFITSRAEIMLPDTVFSCLTPQSVITDHTCSLTACIHLPPLEAVAHLVIAPATVLWPGLPSTSNLGHSICSCVLPTPLEGRHFENRRPSKLAGSTLSCGLHGAGHASPRRLPFCTWLS